MFFYLIFVVLIFIGVVFKLLIWVEYGVGKGCVKEYRRIDFYRIDIIDVNNFKSIDWY